MPISPDSDGYGLVEYLRNHVSDRHEPPAMSVDSSRPEDWGTLVPDPDTHCFDIDYPD